MSYYVNTSDFLNEIVDSIDAFYRQLGLIRTARSQHNEPRGNNDNHVIYISDSEDDGDNNNNIIDGPYDPSEWQWESEEEAPGLDEIQLFDQQQQQRETLISVKE